MAVDRAKIIIFETDLRALKEMQNRLSSFCVVLGFFEADRVLTAIHGDRDIKTVIVSTARGSDSLELLESIRRTNPLPLRVLLTGFEDLTLVVEGLHSGTVQRVMSKPLQDTELLCMVRGFGPAAWSGTQPTP